MITFLQSLLLTSGVILIANGVKEVDDKILKPVAWAFILLGGIMLTGFANIVLR